MKDRNDVIVKKMQHCGKCGEVFSDNFERCPKCGSHDFVGYTVTNPVARLPMEAILRVMAHLMWILGTAICVAFLWSTDSEDADHNMLLMYMGFTALCVSIFISVTLFALGEMLKRIIRIQRRLRAMFDDQQGHGG